MTTTTTVLAAAVIIASAVASFTPPVHGLGGSASTFAVVYRTPTVCGIVAKQQVRRIQCWTNGRKPRAIEPSTASFDSIAGGRFGFCAVRSGGYPLICWDRSFSPKRIYFNSSVQLDHLTYGAEQVCALTNGTRSVRCWRDFDFDSHVPDELLQFDSISSGYGYSCGVLSNSGRVTCWGSDPVSEYNVQSQFKNIPMSSIVVGGNYACGFDRSGLMICATAPGGYYSWPSDAPPYEFSGIALGENHGCAIRRSNGTVICFGQTGIDFYSNVIEGVSFLSVEAGLDFTCGLTTNDLSIICWGPGWSGDSLTVASLPLPPILPGPCVALESTCECGIYPLSSELCAGNGKICKPCPNI